MLTQTIIAREAPAVQPPAGDPQALARLRHWGGEALLQRLGCVFLDEAKRRIAAARAGAAAGDAAEIRRAMHALRSSCGQLGAVSMQEVCEQIEAAAVAGEVPRARRLLGALEREFERYRRWLDAETPTTEASR